MKYRRRRSLEALVPMVQGRDKQILGLHIRMFASHQCADYVRASYAGAGEARVPRVTFAVGLPYPVWCL